VATNEHPTVVGVFRDQTLVEQTIQELRHAGFRDDQIKQFGPGTGSGGILSTIKNTFAGHENDAADNSAFNTLVNMGVSREDAQYYQQEIDAGHSVVAIESYGHQQEASNILYQHGAYDALTQPDRLENTQSVPIREEVLQVQKQAVETGEVFIYKRVITEEKTITVPVMHEEIVVERRLVSTTEEGGDQPAGATVGRIIELGEGETISIPIRAEQISVEKRPIVTEVLIVGKQKVEETRHITDTVQREVPIVERKGDVDVESRGIDVG
jgi:uncharacterized protein (TIGR02271 family)